MAQTTRLIQTLKYVVECLDRADQLLNEVDTIGLWVKSDDCSDNRRKRTALRETDWTLYGAVAKINNLLPDVPAAQVALGQLCERLRKLVAVAEPLPDRVTDISDKDPELDKIIRDMRDEIAELRDRAQLLLRVAATR